MVLVGFVGEGAAGANYEQVGAHPAGGVIGHPSRQVPFDPCDSEECHLN